VKVQLQIVSVVLLLLSCGVFVVIMLIRTMLLPVVSLQWLEVQCYVAGSGSAVATGRIIVLLLIEAVLLLIKAVLLLLEVGALASSGNIVA